MKTIVFILSEILIVKIILFKGYYCEWRLNYFDIMVMGPSYEAYQGLPPISIFEDVEISQCQRRQPFDYLLVRASTSFLTLSSQLRF